MFQGIGFKPNIEAKRAKVVYMGTFLNRFVETKARRKQIV